jgi:hypothetical protein
MTASTTRPASALDLKHADWLVRQVVCGCDSLDDLLDKWVDHGYTPTLFVDEPRKAKLADLYDQRAAERGLEIRAYRAGLRSL